jgi:predicted adenylyl cyclase CyaB
MGHINIEIKARCADLARARRVLGELGARFVGLDHQIDTYFRCSHGRLKLREGNIERALIHYLREDQAGPKCSQVILYQPQPGNELKEILTRALGVLVVVDKRREIYFADNVKLHLDEVAGLGTFVEIEAIEDEAHPGREGLLAQCQAFMAALNVLEEDLLECSYSDMFLTLRARHS